MQGVNNATTQLLTLLNVSALKSTVRKRVDTDETLPFVPGRKLNARNKINVVAQDMSSPDEDDKEAASDPEDVEMEENGDESGVADEETAGDPYEAHFGPSPNILTPGTRSAIDGNQWQTSSRRIGKLGNVTQSLPEGAMDPSSSKQRDAILERLRTPFIEQQKSAPSEQIQLQNDILSTLANGQDLHLTRTALETRQSVREAISLYALNHVTKKRRRILKNNERLTHHAKSNPSAKSGDFLSSIEILVVDQMDALTMQNWEHIQFVFSHLNQIPKESHDADFSRIKPWFLDGYAAYLRQSVLLSAYETPEIRSIYNKSLKNVAGKLRTEHTWRPLQVPDGIDQQFNRVEYTNIKDELDKRFDAFTKTLLPAVLKSAVQSVNTLVFVPSSFDFIRVHNYFRKRGDISFVALSEYSSNQDISRARQAFFNGKKAFLLISERFHFFRRYKLRGVRNILFYGLPDHANFYSEIVSFPFLDEAVEPSDVVVRVLWSSLDAMKLERIVGTEEAGVMIHA